MLTALKKINYQAFGLKVLSEIVIPEFQMDEFKDEEADVVIKIADLSQFWEDDTFRKDGILISEDMVVFHIPYVAVYKIQGGSEITISPFEVSNNDQINQYLLNTCMTSMLFQRRILPLQFILPILLEEDTHD